MLPPIRQTLSVSFKYRLYHPQFQSVWGFLPEAIDSPTQLCTGFSTWKPRRGHKCNVVVLIPKLAPPPAFPPSAKGDQPPAAHSKNLGLIFDTSLCLASACLALADS